MARFDLPPEDLEDYKITNQDIEAEMFVEANQKDCYVLESDIVRQSREEIISQLGPRAIALMNIPRTFTEADVKKLLLKYGDIEQVHIKKNLFGWTSHAIVEFYKESTLERVQKMLADHWIGAHKVRVFTNKDRVTECFNH